MAPPPARWLLKRALRLPKWSPAPAYRGRQGVRRIGAEMPADLGSHRDQRAVRCVGTAGFEPATPLTPSHIPGVAGRRPRGLTGHLTSLNGGSAWLAVACCRSTLALRMALRCDVLHTLTVDGLSVARYQPDRQALATWTAGHRDRA